MCWNKKVFKVEIIERKLQKSFTIQKQSIFCLKVRMRNLFCEERLRWDSRKIDLLFVTFGESHLSVCLTFVKSEGFSGKESNSLVNEINILDLI